MTTIPAEPKKRHRLTQEDCDTARLLMARQRTLKEIAEIIGVDPSTVGKIRLADYDLEKYLDQRKAMNRKTKEKKKMTKFAKAIDETLEEQRLPEIAGQMQMDLEQQEDNPEEDMRKYFLMGYDDSKQMKFQAAMMDKLLKKLDELIAVLKGGEKG